MKKSKISCRVESDSMGKVKIPKNALFGPQTQRAVDNFKISELVLPKEFIISILLIKIAAAEANCKLGLLSKKITTAIIKSAEYLIKSYDPQRFSCRCISDWFGY